MRTSLNYLLDTHIFLWYISGNSNLKNNFKEIIQNTENNIYISTASFWEISILSIDEDCLYYLEQLPDIHKDPFDRILISQAFSNNLIFITEDDLILKYNVKTVF